MSNYNLKQKQSFIRWKHYAEIEKVREEMINQIKKKLLERLESNRNTASVSNQKEALKKFKQNAQTWKFIQSLHRTLLNTKSAKMLQVFSRWRNLPDIRSQTLKSRAANRLELSLTRITDAKLKSIFDPLKAEHAKGSESLRKSCLVLMLNTVDNTRKYFDEWRNRAIKLGAVEKTMQTLKFFESINAIVTESNRPLLKVEEKMNSKEHAIKNLIQNCRGKLREAFVFWRAHSQM